MKAWCSVIGVLDDGAASLTSEALQLIREAKHVIAGERLLATMAEDIKQAKHYDLTGHLKEVPGWIAAALEKNEVVVVLASGDPLCNGIGGFLAGKMDKTRIRILPNLSTLQLTFAHLQLAWQNATLVSVHSKDAGEWHIGSDATHGLYDLVQQCRHKNLLAIFTSPENNPQRIANMLLLENMAEDFEMAVAQALKQPTQDVTDFLPVKTAAQMAFLDPNIVVLKRKTKFTHPILFGVADEKFQQRKPEKGLITKREVRAVSLARMQLSDSSIVWDIGAGSGSVGLEAARLCRFGHVYAIEKNAEDIANIQQNRQAWQLSNYSIVHGKAPAFLDNWANPDAVFIGGSGGELAELIEICLHRLNPGGWLVMNFVTLENLSLAVETLKKLNARWDVCQIQTSRSVPILNMQRLQAENPVWIISATANEIISDKEELVNHDKN